MTKKTILIISGVIAVALVALFVGGSSGPSPAPTSTPSPVSLGGLIEQRAVNFVNGLKVGKNEDYVIDGNKTLVQGGLRATLSSGSYHFTTSDLCDNSIFQWNARASASNGVFPTAASLISDCLKTIGDHKSILFENTANDESFTLVKGQGIDVLRASGSQEAIGSNERALVEFWNIDGASVSATVIELGDAD